MTPAENRDEKAPDKFRRSFDEATFRQFVADNPHFLDDNYKVGIFAVGVLVKLLLNIQRWELDGGTPFEKKLKGYNLDPVSIKQIYIEAQAKIAQYREPGSRYESLGKIINEYFILNSYKLPTISNNELSFYFVAGLEMASQFRKEAGTENNPLITE